MNGEMPKTPEQFEEWAKQRGLFRPSREGTLCTNYYDDFVACWQEATRQAMERAIEAVEFESLNDHSCDADQAYDDALTNAADAIRRALSDMPAQEGEL